MDIVVLLPPSRFRSFERGVNLGGFAPLAISDHARDSIVVQVSSTQHCPFVHHNSFRALAKKFSAPIRFRLISQNCYLTVFRFCSDRRNCGTSNFVASSPLTTHPARLQRPNRSSRGPSQYCSMRS
jgi:hypothetical protein